MTKQQIKVFNDLLESEKFRGKKMLKYLLWANTTEPKYKPGDCFLISKPGERVYGYPVKNFKAKVIRSYSFKEDCVWRYELEAIVRCGGKQTDTKQFASETELNASRRCDGNLTILGDPIDDAPQSMDV